MITAEHAEAGLMVSKSPTTSGTPRCLEPRNFLGQFPLRAIDFLGKKDVRKTKPRTLGSIVSLSDQYKYWYCTASTPAV